MGASTSNHTTRRRTSPVNANENQTVRTSNTQRTPHTGTEQVHFTHKRHSPTQHGQAFTNSDPRWRRCTQFCGVHSAEFASESSSIIGFRSTILTICRHRIIINSFTFEPWTRISHRRDHPASLLHALVRHLQLETHCLSASLRRSLPRGRCQYCSVGSCPPPCVCASRVHCCQSRHTPLTAPRLPLPTAVAHPATLATPLFGAQPPCARCCTVLCSSRCGHPTRAACPARPCRRLLGPDFGCPFAECGCAVAMAI